jgi:hypothetical protein
MKTIVAVVIFSNTCETLERQIAVAELHLYKKQQTGLGASCLDCGSRKKFPHAR